MIFKLFIYLLQSSWVGIICNTKYITAYIR